MGMAFWGLVGSRGSGVLGERGERLGEGGRSVREIVLGWWRTEWGGVRLESLGEKKFW